MKAFFVGIFNTIIYKPLYNLLILLVLLIPGNHLWVAVIALTLLVKFILAPFSYRALVSQVKNKKIQPIVDKIKKDNPGDKQLQAQKQLEIYQKMKVNPFSGCLPTIVQVFLVIGLFTLFRAKDLMSGEFVYSFVNLPEKLNTAFAGIADITQVMDFSEVSVSIIVLAVLAGVFQHIQVRLSPAFKKDKVVKDPNLGAPSMAATMQEQMSFVMKYGLPVMIIFFGLTFPPALTIYWIVNSLFTIGQELVVRPKLKAIEAEVDLNLQEINV